MKKAIIISGATASGKSSLALDFAAKRNVAIINADALQIYQGLPILSAQPTWQEAREVPHFLYSHFAFDAKTSVALWLNLVRAAITQAFADSRIPVIVGGTGMYISKLCDGISKVPEISDEIKQKSRDLYQEIDRQKFIENLRKMGEGADIDGLDKQRLIRLHEVLSHTGKTLKYWQSEPKKFVIDPTIFTHINLEIDRQKLYENCNLRFENMFKNGAAEEVASLIAKGANDDMQITKTLGFYEIRDFLSGKMTKSDALELSSQKTRNYAKRQLTWFKNQFKNRSVFNNKKDALNFLNNLDYEI